MSKSYSKNRIKLLKTKKFVCYYCKRLIPRKDVTIDHKIPKSRGGGNTQNNLVICCRECNAEKADMTDFEYSIWRIENAFRQIRQ